MAEILCHALTAGYLRPALLGAGLDPDSVIVWHDTSDLRARPDRTEAATAAYDRYELSGTALLRESGLSEEDIPDDDERRRRLLEDIAKSGSALAPQALQLLGVDVTEPAAPAATPTETAPGAPEGGAGPPDRGTAPPPSEEPSAALLAACDGMVHRALERAGARLKSFAGRGREGGAAAVQCDDLALFHTKLDATVHANLDALLTGAWVRVPSIAARYDRNPAELTRTLDAYTRALIAAGHAHDHDRLAAALGLYATV
jgi:hypothetical protein